MPSIKVDQTDKGKSHWESFLLKKQEIRLLKLLNQLEVKADTQNTIMKLFSKSVDFKNIIPLYNHDIRNFLHAMLNGELGDLEKSSDIKLTTKYADHEKANV